MPYNKNQIPDAPIAGSMLPRATEFHDNDILVLIQPNNPIGQRNKSTTLGDLKEIGYLAKKSLITSTAPIAGSWEVDLTDCFPHVLIQLIRPDGRGDTFVDRVILKNAPADTLMTVEISVDFGVVTGSLVVHLGSKDHSLGNLWAKYLDAGIGVFKNTTKEGFCQLPGTVSNEYQDLFVSRNLEALNFKPRVSGLDILTGDDATYTYEPEYDTASEAAAVPVHTIVNKRSTSVEVTFNGVAQYDNAVNVRTIWLNYSESLMLIPIDTITGIVGLTPGKYTPRFSYIGGHDTDPVA